MKDTFEEFGAGAMKELTLAQLVPQRHTEQPHMKEAEGWHLCGVQGVSAQHTAAKALGWKTERLSISGSRSAEGRRQAPVEGSLSPLLGCFVSVKLQSA